MMTRGTSDCLSYSVCVDYKSNFRTDPLKQILPRRIHSWIDDSSVISCYGCNVQFSIMRCIRKHHCRLCGRIFCYNCSNFYAIIPDNLLSDDSKKGTLNDYIWYYASRGPTKYRVCKNCSEILHNIESAKKLIEIFRLSKLTVIDLMRASRVCKIWQYAANYILSIFREIQYKLPTDGYSNHEVELLWINSRYFSCHNKYLIHLLKACSSIEDFKGAIDVINCKVKSENCWTMMCSRNCKSKLTSSDALNLLIYSFKDDSKHDSAVLNRVRSIAIEYMVCSNIEFKCYIPILVYYMKYDVKTIPAFLIKRCKTSFSLFSALYWELQFYLDTKDQHSDKVDSSNIYLSVLEQLKRVYFKRSKDGKANLLKQILFTSTIATMSKSVYDSSNQELQELQELQQVKNNIISPFYQSKPIKDILVEKIKIKNSKTKPILIPYQTCDDRVHKILYKCDDVRKDQVILNIIRIIDLIIKQEENLDLDIVTYGILPIDKDHGIIEAINNSDTVSHIKNKLNSTILNYIFEDNGDVKVKEVRERFIRSTAAYCVIMYLLGIGDRHPDNIMVAKDGRLFHIDYGYILGRDPNYGTTTVKITPQIIEAIGGQGSSNYVEFCELCTRIYNCLRRNIDIIMNMMMVLPKVTTLDITENEIREHIIKRFIPGENFINAKLHFEKQLENQSYTETIKDWFHYINTEKIKNLRLKLF
jgi:hypothetical protein